MATAPALQATFEQTDSGQQQYVLRSVAAQLSGVRDELSGIRAILLAGQTASQAVQEQAQAFLDAQQAKVDEYMQQVELTPPVDVHPFVELPVQTQVQELPDGNRLFILPDGLIMRTTDDQGISVVDQGEQRLAKPGPGHTIEVAPGRVFKLTPHYLNTTQEIAGVSGVPAGVEVVPLGDTGYTMTLDGIRLDINHLGRYISLINPAGPIDIIGLTRCEGFGEVVSVRVLPDGAVGFQCLTSGHGGLVDPDGTINLSLKSGLDLVVRFPNPDPEAGAGSGGLCGLECQIRDTGLGALRA